MMKMAEKTKKFLILDCNSHPIAHGLMLSSDRESGWTMRVLADKIGAVTQLRELELVSLSDYQVSYLARVTGSRGDQIDLEPLRPLGAQIRETLRIPVSFHSFIYPLSGRWKGRRAVQAVDLSCGGIAFSCEQPLDIGEHLEVVIPITRSPLLLTCQVLRTRPSPTGGTIYSLKFVDLCDDADKFVQEFVFNEQIRSQAS